MSSREHLLPTYNITKKWEKTIVKIKFSNVAWVTIALPFFSFLFCVIWSTLYNFADANATHCQVDNYLPSVSAAIGSFSPQKYIWMVSISLHFFPRLVVSKMYLEYFSQVIDSRSTKLYEYTWLLNVVEIFCLLGLTLISSTFHYSVHAFCFVSFVFASILYMMFSCFLLKFRRKIPPNNLESRVLRWKLQCFVINLTCFMFAGYFFYRHNKYCEPGIYSIFAMFEYAVVLTNMIFHVLAIWDFHDKIMTVTSGGVNIS